MKVGTDGVLLGAWFSVRGDERRILDIGTGTGVIALMAAQRTPAESIVAVDIDRPSAECAAGNFRNSPWAGRLRAECAAVQDFDDGTFDLILSNPPYFVDSLLPDKAGRIAGRALCGDPAAAADGGAVRFGAAACRPPLFGAYGPWRTSEARNGGAVACAVRHGGFGTRHRDRCPRPFQRRIQAPYM